MKYFVSATYTGSIDADEADMFEWVNEMLSDPRNLDWLIPAATLDNLEVEAIEFRIVED